MSSGAGCVYKRGDTWWISYYQSGKRKRESSGSTRKGDATALLRQRLAEMGQGRWIGSSAERVTFDDLARIIEDDYVVQGRKSVRRLRTSLKHLREQFAGDCAVTITTARLRRYVRMRQDEGAANASIRKETMALQRAFNLAIEDGLLHAVPAFPTISVDNARKGFFSRSDVDELCEHLDADIAAVVRFAFLTGWRRAEILTLTWDRVDWDAATVRVDDTKTGEPRIFPFGVLPELASLLRCQRERSDAVQREHSRIVRHVFHRKGQEIKGFRRQWEKATDRAGHPGAWFHDLRRSAIRNFERAGISRSVSMRLSGHKTESTYRRYAIADSVALAEGVAKLAAFGSVTKRSQSERVQQRGGER